MLLAPGALSARGRNQRGAILILSVLWYLHMNTASARGPSIRISFFIRLAKPYSSAYCIQLSQVLGIVGLLLESRRALVRIEELRNVLA